MAKKFSELRSKMSPEARERSRLTADRILQYICVHCGEAFFQATKEISVCMECAQRSGRDARAHLGVGRKRRKPSLDDYDTWAAQ
jgi:hypothetical protein